jgi:hypothetical protein
MRERRRARRYGVEVHRRAGPGEDLRTVPIAPEGRVPCTAERPWSGNRADAPRGVRHVDAQADGGEFACPHCGTRWPR